MFDCFLTQLLILFLMFCCCIRVFFTKNSKIDSATVLAPWALLISVVAFFMWGNVTFALPLIALSLVVFLTNVRSLFRLASRLYVDRYSAVFLFFTILELLVILAGFVFVLLDRPVKISAADFNVVKKSERLTGSLYSGFTVADQNKFNLKTTGYLYTYIPAPVKETKSDDKVSETPAAESIQELTEGTPVKPVIIFAGTNSAEVVDYEPYLMFLAQKGCSVMAADFYSSDMTYFSKLWQNLRYFRKSISIRKISEKNDDKETAEIIRKNTVKSYAALTKLAKTIYGEDRQLFFVTDSLDYESIFEITENAGTQALGFYPLSKIAEYKTPGLGFIEQSNVALAKTKGLGRDSSLFIPRYAAGKTVEELKALQL